MQKLTISAGSHPGRRMLLVLLFGFAVLIVLLSISSYVDSETMAALEQTATTLVMRQRATTRLIDEAQRQEIELTSLLYSVAQGAGGRQKAQFQARVNALEKELDATTAEGVRSSEAELWGRVRSAGRGFIAEVRHILETGKPPPASFYRSHEDYVSAISRLVGSGYQSEGEAANRAFVESHRQVRQSLVLIWGAILLSIAGAALTIRIAQQIFHRLEWQAEEFAKLSARMLESQEETARRFSRELHDEFGQTLTAIQANLVALRHAVPDAEGRIEDSLTLVKEAQSNAREMSQLLRPSILDDFGLDAGLRWLAETFAKRTGIDVQYESAFTARLNDETETHLFRIAQEALTNVARHSDAKRATMRLERASHGVRLRVEDNGQGFAKLAPHAGMGLAGMRTRAESLGGHLEVSARPGRGVTITVEVPAESPHARAVTENPHPLGR